jgi:protoheme IX farnesyltransferase
VDYLSLTKPRIVELLLITTVPAMLVAAGGWPGLGLVVATVVGGGAVSGSAHATNMVLDRDIDGAMRRTAHRPLPSGRITPKAALVFAALLLLGGAGLLLSAAGWLAASLTVAAWLWYVGVYTMWLKRRSVQNIVIGGVAGAAPPMIGWAAVTGNVDPPALVLFAVVVLWTPTHFWALAVGTGQDYERANVPMLPVVRGPKVAARHGAVYAVLTVAASLLLPLTGVGGTVFVVVAGGLGAAFIVRAVRLIARPEPAAAWKVFHTSNAYLAAVFVLVGITGFWG